MDVQQKEKMVQVLADFIGYVSKHLPDDVAEKLQELSEAETDPMAKTIYATMKENQRLADELSRPACQDTGVLQFWIRCGAKYPYIGELEDIVREATIKATEEAPLRHNCIETFDEYNTGNNTGLRAPYVTWDIIPDSDEVDMYTYMAGGGCSLPGSGKTLMPGEGYAGAAKFVFDLMTSYGLNACPPLLVGIGLATSIDTAAALSKKALMRSVQSKNPNPKAAEMERLLEEGLNELQIGPQGMGGQASVMGVNIENGARHPAVLSVAVSVGCWNHRRGHIRFTKDGAYIVESHKGVTFHD